MRNHPYVIPEAVEENLLKALPDEVAPALIEVAFVRHGQLSVWPNSAGVSLFHIGSITKTFTALLLAQMIEAGEVSVDDQVGAYLPEAAGCADVRLVELATHTSGLPQLPDPLAARGAACPHDPYSGVAVEDVVEAASLAAPGAGRGNYEYSNFGYALLGLVLAAAAGESFESALRRRVLHPLQLSDTIFDVDDDPRLVDGHDLAGTSVPHWHNPAMAGCGALLATVADVGRYIAAQLRPGTTALEAPIDATHEIRLRIASGRAAALGWVVDEASDRHRYWHNGGTYGFSAYAAFIPAADAGLAVVLSQAPAGDGRLEQLGNKLLDAFVE